jgi:hypothetical protein
MTASLPGAASRRAPSCAHSACTTATETPRLASPPHRFVGNAVRRGTRAGALAAAFAGLLLAACGGGGSSGGTTGSSAPVAADYFPLAQGGRWLYHETWSDGEGYFQADVGGASTVDGHAVTALVYTEVDGTLLDNRDFAADASGVSIYPDASDDQVSRALGRHLLLPANIAPGNTAVIADTSVTVDDFDGDGHPDTLQIHADLKIIGSEALVTPAATFDAALHEHITETTTAKGSAGKPPVAMTTNIDQWFVAGVGRVRSVSTTAHPDGTLDVDTVELVAWRTAGKHGGPQPGVTNTLPASDGTFGGTGTEVSATFDMPMDAASLDAGGFQVVDAGGQAVAGHVGLSPDGGKATFVPNAGWHSGQYTARITASALDRYASPATPASWQFGFDVVAPTIVGTTPTSLSGIGYATPLIVRFSEPLAADAIALVGDAVVVVTDDATGTEVDIARNFDGVSTFTLAPKTAWTHGHAYTVTFAADAVTDVAGNKLASGVLHFTVGPGHFAAPVAIANGADVVGVAIGDVDGDGRNDVVYATSDNRLYLRRGASGGTLLPSTLLFDGSLTCDLGDVAIADVDGDGRKDVVVGSERCGAQLLLQDASGAFTVDGRMSGLLGRVIRVADLNGDGRLDIAGFDAYDNTVKISTQDAGGAFACCEVVAGDVPQIFLGLDVADVDGDGRIDLVASGYAGITVMRQQPGGTFAAATLSGANPAPNGLGVAVGDLDGDGRQEIFATGGYFGDSFSSNTLYAATPGGGFALASYLPTGTTGPAAHVRLVDVDGDGRTDAVVAHGDGSVGLYLQNADGTLGAEDPYPVAGSSASTALAVGDLTGDGRLDVIVGNFLFAGSAATAQPQGALRSGHVDAGRARVHAALVARSHGLSPKARPRFGFPAGAH